MCRPDRVLHAREQEETEEEEEEQQVEKDAAAFRRTSEALDLFLTHMPPLALSSGCVCGLRVCVCVCVCVCV